MTPILNAISFVITLLSYLFPLTSTAWCELYIYSESNRAGTQWGAIDITSCWHTEGGGNFDNDVVSSAQLISINSGACTAIFYADCSCIPGPNNPSETLTVAPYNDTTINFSIVNNKVSCITLTVTTPTPTTQTLQPTTNEPTTQTMIPSQTPLTNIPTLHPTTPNPTTTPTYTNLQAGESKEQIVSTENENKSSTNASNEDILDGEVYIFLVIAVISVLLVIVCILLVLWIIKYRKRYDHNLKQIKMNPEMTEIGALSTVIRSHSSINNGDSDHQNGTEKQSTVTDDNVNITLYTTNQIHPINKGVEGIQENIHEDSEDNSEDMYDKMQQNESVNGNTSTGECELVGTTTKGNVTKGNVT